MSKTTIVNYGDDSRKKLIDGVNQLADAVVTTLGPNGRNVVIQNEFGVPQSTKDGVTVAKAIKLEDTVENTGAQMVKQAAIKTAEQAGDGTTTSTLLAREIVNAGSRYSDKGHNIVEIKRGIDKCVKAHVAFLREMSQDISSEDQLRQVATISANNDEEVGELIATAMEKVGRDGVVTIEESRSGETYLETVEGLQFDRGYKSPYFVTNNDTMSANLKDTMILFYNGRITTVKDLLPLLENAKIPAIIAPIPSKIFQIFFIYYFLCSNKDSISFLIAVNFFNLSINSAFDFSSVVSLYFLLVDFNSDDVSCSLEANVEIESPFN